jgi:glycosyltransferase involved in cell wall biosynthesis
MGEPFRVVFYWEADGLALDSERANPYGGLLAHALASHDVALEAGWSLDPEWVQAQHGRIHALHLNWIHRFYADPDPAERRRKFRVFAAGLVLARRLGMRLVWTMHNLYPHEQHDPQLDRRARRLVCALAHAVIAHCSHAADLLAEHFGRRDGVHVIPHGHFIDVYPNTIDRTTARRRLGLPDAAFVYLFLGHIRPYKGVERLLDAFSALPGANLRLVVAGRLLPGYTGDLGRLGDDRPLGDDRIRFRPGIVAIDEMQVYFNAADAVVLPFVDTLTSGSAITALGFGRPVVMPAIGCLPELVTGRACGVLYEPRAPTALREALRRVRTLDLDTAGVDAVARARELSWGPIARQTLAAYGLEGSAAQKRCP